MQKLAGFTLIELSAVLLVVLSIIAVFIALSPPSIPSFRADSFAGVLLQDLQLTKIFSMSQNQRYRMVLGASSYQIQDQNGTAIINPGTHTTTVSYPTGVSVSPATTVIFDSLGGPYDGSNTALAANLVLTLSSSSNSKTITIVPQTGFIQ